MVALCSLASPPDHSPPGDEAVCSCDFLPVVWHISKPRYIPGATLVLSEDFPVFLFPSQFHAWLEEYPQNRENRWLVYVYSECLLLHAHSCVQSSTACPRLMPSFLTVSPYHTHTHTHSHTTPAHVYTQWPQTSVRGIRSIGVCPPECVSHLVLSTAIHSWLSKSGIQQWVE